MSGGRRTVSLSELEGATPTRPEITGRALVADLSVLRELCVPLGRKLSLVQVRNEHEWERLRRAAPGVGSVPDFSRGIAVALICTAGTPLDGGWPAELKRVRVSGGAGLVEARFHGGSYLADGTGYVEVSYVPELRAVLVVDVDGNRYFP